MHDFFKLFYFVSRILKIRREKFNPLSGFVGKKLIRVKRGPREFTADHPFIATLAVRNDSLSSILFIGRISNPNS